MKDFIIKKIGKKPKLRKPVIIEGLPGIGNVARIVVDILVEKLKAKKYAVIYSNYFPNSVFINEDKVIEMPKVNVYYYKAKRKTEKDIILLIGDAQPAEEYASYIFSRGLVDVAEEMGAKEIITLGGINSPQSRKNPPVYGAVTDKKMIPKLKKIGVKFDRKGSVVVVGAAGLMLSLGKLKKIDGFSLLSETNSDPRVLGLNAAESILEILIKYLNVKISIDDIKADVKTMTTGLPSKKRKVLKKKLMKKYNVKSEPKFMHYIG